MDIPLFRAEFAYATRESQRIMTWMQEERRRNDSVIAQSRKVLDESHAFLRKH